MISRTVCIKDLAQDLFLLASNSPWPSPILTAEASTELLSLYCKCADWICLSTEYLTLLEISNSSAVPMANIEGLQSLCKKQAGLFTERRLKIRAYAALALSIYKTRGLHERDPQVFE